MQSKPHRRPLRFPSPVKLKLPWLTAARTRAMKAPPAHPLEDTFNLSNTQACNTSPRPTSTSQAWQDKKRNGDSDRPKTPGLQRFVFDVVTTCKFGGALLWHRPAPSSPKVTKNIISDLHKPTCPRIAKDIISDLGK